MPCGPAWIFAVRYRRAVRASLRTARKGRAITARLIVRRVRDQNIKAAGTGELFPVWRCCPVFTGSPFTLLQAGARHRDHSIAGQLPAGWTDGPPGTSLPAPPAILHEAKHGHAGRSKPPRMRNRTRGRRRHSASDDRVNMVLWGASTGKVPSELG